LKGSTSFLDPNASWFLFEMASLVMPLQIAEVKRWDWLHSEGNEVGRKK
jgi:hypothetical protein